MGRKVLNAFMLVFAFLIATTMVATCVHRYADSIDSLFNHESECEELSNLYDEVPSMTVKEYVDWREDLREQTRVDSIFMTMPEPILVHILYNHGTDLSLSEIVYIYESNIDEFNKVLEGANIQQLIDSLKRY